MKVFRSPKLDVVVVDRDGQRGINMVDLMMWLVIAALLLAAAIQGIGYYQKATYVHLLKSDLTGVASRVMAEASLARGVIDTDVVDTAAADSNWSDEVTYLVEGSERSPYLRASHTGVADVDALYLFESCAPYGVGVHIVPKGGDAFLEDCGIFPPTDNGGGNGGGGTPVEPVNPDIDGDGIPNEADWDNDKDGKDDDEAIPAGYTPGGRTFGFTGTPRTLVGNIESARLTSGATPSLYVTFYIPSGQVGKGISIDLSANCVRADKSTYVDRRVTVYTVPNPHWGGALGTNIGRCGTDRMASFIIQPLTQESLASGEISNAAEATNFTFNDGYRWSEPDGYAKTGNLEATSVVDGGKAVEAVYYTGTSPLGNRLVAQFKALCERTDKTIYKVNKLVYTDKVATGNHSIFKIPTCADGRVDSYTLKPVTALSEVENRSDFTTGYSLDGTRSWEETANGYSLFSNLESVTRVSNDTVLEVRAYIPYGSMNRLINTQYELTCKAGDGSTRKINRIASYTVTSNSPGAIMFPVTACGSDQLMAYTFTKVHSLGIVENPDDFKTHTFDRTYSWTRP